LKKRSKKLLRITGMALPYCGRSSAVVSESFFGYFFLKSNGFL
jgi:hypothetical protein